MTDTKQRRLFVALPIDLSQDESYLQMHKKLKIESQKRKMEFYWIPLQNYHITLNFLGSTEEHLVDEIRSRLDEVAAKFHSFKLEISGIGAFSDPQHCRTLWLGVQKKSELESLQLEIASPLEELGFMREEFSYKPHLTIAKLRKSRSVVDLISPWVRKSFGKFHIQELVLFESHLSGGFVNYEPVSKHKLT